MTREVTIFVNSLSAGGGQIFSYNLAIGLKNRGYTVKVVALFGILDDVGIRMNKKLLNEEVVVFYGGRSLFALVKLSILVLLRIHSDIWHTNLDHSDIFVKILGFLKRQKRLVRTLHTENFSPNLSMFHGFLRKGFKNVACSKSVASSFINQGVEIDEIILNGVHDYGQSTRYFEEVLIIAVVGNFNRVHGIEVKNQRFILKVLSELEIPYLCRFYGDGELREELETEANMLNLPVEFFGNVFNIQQRLSECHLFLSASKFEGMPLSALEALSTGLPLLLSDIDAHTRIEEATHYESENVEECAFKIVEFYKYFRGIEYAAKFPKEYGINNMLDMYEKVY